MNTRTRQRGGARARTRNGGVLAAALLSAVCVAGCESLLEVELPDAVTDVALTDPVGATVQVNSVIGQVECGWSAFAVEASGYEDAFQATTAAVGSGYADYSHEAGSGLCDTGDTTYSYFDAFMIARAFGMQTYDRVTDWTQEQLGTQNRERLLAQTALYVAISLDVFGEHFCDIVIDNGPIMTPGEGLDLAEEWADRALGHLETTGDFAGVNNSTTSLRTMAYGVRARIRWANGDLAGAASDAAQVPDGYTAMATRESALVRRNKPYNTHTAVKYGRVNGPIDYWDGAEPNPVTGQTWPAVIPFTGYLDLAIEANGRAVDADGYPITTATAGSVADTRVRTLANQSLQGGVVGSIPQKWSALTDDIPIINWKEMRLIRAEAEPASAVEHVNAIRTRDDLPLVTYGPAGEQVENMIIEERRRALWLEGRFWATKILNTDKLWFPRLEGNDQHNHDMLGGVRLVYPLEEYRLNPSLTEDDRGLGCRDNEWADQAPELGLGGSV